MRNVLLITFLLGIISCTTKPSYEVRVKLTAAEGKALLSQRLKGDWVKLDSVALIDGEGVFNGVVKNPQIYYLGLSSKKDKLPFLLTTR